MTVCLLQHVRTHKMWHCNGESLSCSNARSQDGKGNFLRKLELFFMDAVLSVTFLTTSRLKLITTMTRLVLTRVCCLTRVGAQKKCIIIAPAVHLFVSGPHNSYSYEIWNKSKTSCWYYLEESGKLCGVSVLPWWELKQDHLSYLSVAVLLKKYGINWKNFQIRDRKMCSFAFIFFVEWRRETEERAQAAEERAIQAETDLKQALEKIRALERSASRASATSAGESQTPADRPVSTSMSKRPTSQASTAQAQTPQPPRTASQQSTRPSTRASTKKK